MDEIKFEDMKPAPGSEEEEAPVSKPIEITEVDPKVIKALDAIDPAQVLQYLKDKKLVPIEIELQMPEMGMEMENPAPESSPISYGEMQA